MFKKKYSLIGMIFILVVTAPLARAKVYEERMISPSDFKVIDSQKVVAELRLSLIRQALKIDVIDYDIGRDPEVSIPFFKALWNAANRGAQVRLIRGGATPEIYQAIKHPFSYDPIEQYPL